MTPDTAEQRMHDIQASQRPHLPALLRRLAQSYLIPLAAALLLATAGGMFLAQFMPSSTASAIIFALNVAVVYYGWNFFEKRHHATALFGLYVTGTRERRLLKALIDEARAGGGKAKADLATQVQRYEAAAQAFIHRSREGTVTRQHQMK